MGSLRRTLPLIRVVVIGRYFSFVFIHFHPFHFHPCMDENMKTDKKTDENNEKYNPLIITAVRGGSSGLLGGQMRPNISHTSMMNSLR